MKKLKLSLENLQGGEILSREQLKKVVGGETGSGEAPSGGPCKNVFQNSQGQWITEDGTCKVALSDASTTTNPYQTTYTPYCHSASFSGPVTLSSNGGTSRCGSS